MPLLELAGLTARYGAAPVLKDLSLVVEEGEIVTLLGSNGAGKSTTLRTISGLVPNVAGRLVFGGASLLGMKPEAIVRLGIAHVPEGRGTFAELTVEENLRLGGIVRSNRAQVRDDIDRFLRFFPRLKERLRQQAGTLSGGEQQMLAISRALMLRPRLMLLDEPSFGLAPLVVQEIFRIMKQINAEEGVGMLIVEQNARLALGMADHAFLLETGRMVMSGTAQELSADESVQRAYLGYAGSESRAAAPAAA